MKFGLFMISEFVEVVVLAACSIGALLRRLVPALRRRVGSTAQPLIAGRTGWLYGAILAHRVLGQGPAALLPAAGHPLDVPPLPLRPDPDASAGRSSCPLGLANVFITGALMLLGSLAAALALVGVAGDRRLVALTLTPRSVPSQPAGTAPRRRRTLTAMTRTRHAPRRSAGCRPRRHH